MCQKINGATADVGREYKFRCATRAAAHFTGTPSVRRVERFRMASSQDEVSKEWNAMAGEKKVSSGASLACGGRRTAPQPMP